MNTNQLIQLKKETLRWIFSISAAVVVYLVIAGITKAIYHPDIDSLKNIAAKLFVEPVYVRPEPIEALLFRLGVIIIIPSLPGFYILFSKFQLINILAKNPVYIFLSALFLALLIALIYFDFAALNPYGPGGGDVPQNTRDESSLTNFDFYFGGLFLGNYLWFYTLILVPLAGCLFFIGFKKYNWDNSKSFKTITSIIGYFVIGCTVAAIILMNTFAFPYSADNKYDFGAVYYSMTQVYAGSYACGSFYKYLRA